MKNEKFLANYLHDIMHKPSQVEPIEIVLNQEQIPKGKAYVVNSCVLFVDIRGSSLISENIGLKNITKLYKMFSSLSAMAVQEHNGKIFQFMGDGFMAAFPQSSGSNAAIDALSTVFRIKDLLENVYKKITNLSWHFECGYAITSGHIYMTRLKAKVFKLHSFGVFPGSATNLSSKLCSISKENCLLVDQLTYSRLGENKIQFYKINTTWGDVYKCEI